MWILAAAGRLLGGGWSPAARSAAKIHAFLLFSGGGGGVTRQAEFWSSRLDFRGVGGPRKSGLLSIITPLQTNGALQLASQPQGVALLAASGGKR
eukprot:COSAG01_NODE_2907_length_6880_cov_10.488204_4_plen_95_part_00